MPGGTSGLSVRFYIARARAHILSFWPNGLQKKPLDFQSSSLRK